MVGLPDNAVKESWSRVESALRVNKYNMPRIRIIVNLAPADIRKEGSAYDLPIAIGILAASEQLKTQNLSKYIIMGELSLDGNCNPLKVLCQLPYRHIKMVLKDLFCLNKMPKKLPLLTA